MKKTVIYDLAKRAYIAQIGATSQYSNHLNARDFETKLAAEVFIAENLLPNLTQKNKENEFWCEGFALTVLEIYV